MSLVNNLMILSMFTEFVFFFWQHESDDYKMSDSQTDGSTGSPHHYQAHIEAPMKVIHKEHDVITAFCINQVSLLTNIQSPKPQVNLLTLSPIITQFFLGFSCPRHWSV